MLRQLTLNTSAVKRTPRPGIVRQPRGNLASKNAHYEEAIVDRLRNVVGGSLLRPSHHSGVSGPT
jgi:hypothetical protein